jgi:hypothetical protein
MKAFYASTHARQYLMEHKEHSKVVTLTDLETGKVYEHPFNSVTDAADNFRIWKKYSLKILPKTFCVATTGVSLSDLRLALFEAGLKLPMAQDLKGFVVYHGPACMCLDEFDNMRIPVLTIQEIKEINRGDRIQKRKTAAGAYSGLFEGVGARG